MIEPGQRYGRLLVLERATSATSRSGWLCVCDCGEEVFGRTDLLLTGRKRSCGCLRFEGRLSTERQGDDEALKRTDLIERGAHVRIPGDGLCVIKGCASSMKALGFCAHHLDFWRRYGHPLLGADLAALRRVIPYKGKERKIWNGIKDRCFNPKGQNFHNYGARGITMCDRWRSSFENFLEDMGTCPAGGSIERDDVNGDYEPSNCRWVPRSEQNRNTRATKLTAQIVADAKRRRGAGETVADIARSLGVRYFTVYQAVTGISWKDVKASDCG
jgi:hypothetical protein